MSATFEIWKHEEPKVLEFEELEEIQFSARKGFVFNRTTKLHEKLDRVTKKQLELLAAYYDEVLDVYGMMEGVEGILQIDVSFSSYEELNKPTEQEED